MQYSTYCNLANKPQPASLLTMETLITKVEKILDYEFESSSLCRDALVASKKQPRLATFSSLPNFGGQDILAHAAKNSGIASLFRVSKNGGVVSDDQLATTVKALLGAIMEETQDENSVCRAAFCLGLEEVSESAEVVEASSESVGDLLGVEEFAFVQCGRVSVPVVESLI